jgi:hypothetical protein
VQGEVHRELGALAQNPLYLNPAPVVARDSKITTWSRGKLDATGTDETTWQRDRRVDIDLK